MTIAAVPARPVLTRNPAFVAGALAIAVALAVLAGWALHIEWLKSLVPSAVQMKVNTALAVLLAGRRWRCRRPAGRRCGPGCWRWQPPPARWASPPDCRPHGRRPGHRRTAGPGPRPRLQRHPGTDVAVHRLVVHPAGHRDRRAAPPGCALGGLAVRLPGAGGRLAGARRLPLERRRDRHRHLAAAGGSQHRHRPGDAGVRLPRGGASRGPAGPGAGRRDGGQPGLRRDGGAAGAVDQRHLPPEPALQRHGAGHRAGRRRAAAAGPHRRLRPAGRRARAAGSAAGPPRRARRSEPPLRCAGGATVRPGSRAGTGRTARRAGGHGAVAGRPLG
jgi:hypothetical protein